MPFDPKDPLQYTVVNSFSGSHNDYRTIGGVVRSTGLPHGTVSGYITNNPDVFSHAPFQPGGCNVFKLNPSFHNPLDSH